MSSVNLLLTGVEAACIYAAVNNELYGLQQDLDSIDVSAADKELAATSVEVCKSVLSKLIAASPDTTYSLCE